MNTSEITVGTNAIAKVGRNEVEVTIVAITENGWQVKSNSTEREFYVTKLERIISEAEDSQNPAPECATPSKKLSLINVAAKVLESAYEPMNAKELIAKAIELDFWQNNGAKTPEQSLYSAIFREMKTKDTPRFRKSETRKGSFEFNQ